MLTTREAATLLAAATHGAPLARLLPPLGFAAPLSLTVRDLARLGIEDGRPRAQVAAGAGTLRALVLEWDHGPALRERLGPALRRLARTAAGSHWLVLARHASRGEVLLAAPAPEAGPLPTLAADRGGVRESDAETLAALAAAAGDRDAPALVHLRWRECLGRDALSHRFYRDLEAAVDDLAQGARSAPRRVDARDRRQLALLTTSRLLFLAFLEAKGWLDRDRAFLRHHVARTAATGPLHARFLEPLCFGTLNTPYERRARAARAFGRVPFLNGGLFQRSPIETRCRPLRFADEGIARLVCELLPRYRLTARETTHELSEAAVDPEMLGRAFESLMAPDARRAHGAFYTPPPMIAAVADAGFAALARGTAAGALDPLQLRVLDPACGSGAFLVHALQTLASAAAARGDARPRSAVRRDVLTRCLFGVDVDPVAVWLCQLRLWLALVVDDERADPMRLPPLPNLDRNVREGDALAGEAFPGTRPTIAGSGDGTDACGLPTLRLRYARASGARKRTLARTLTRQERRDAAAALDATIARLTARRRDLLAAVRSPRLFGGRRTPGAEERRALEALRAELREARAARRRLADGGALPFAFATHFQEVAARGGFDLAVGNPPWARPHAVPPAQRARQRERFRTARDAAWRHGAEEAGAGRGFASQADLAALFTERAVQLTRPGGLLALLLPAKLWSALAGGGVRALLADTTDLVEVHDWGSGSAAFDAVVYPSAVVARRRGSAVPPTTEAALVLHRAAGTARWMRPAAALALDGTPGAPWLLVPPAVRAAFDAIAEACLPLARSAFGRPILGVKSGCNAAFIIEDPHAADVADASGAAAGIERPMLRPLARGEHLRPFALAPEAASSRIVWTHAPHGPPLARLPEGAARWLTRWRRPLESRADGRSGPWWMLFRTEGARHDRARVVWCDIGRAPRAAVLPAGDLTVPLNTCYVVHAPSLEDAHALAALLNSPVAAAWLGALAEPARGGYRRFLGWTCARLPLPRDWARARTRLAPLGAAGAAGRAPDDATLTAAALEAFGIAPAAVAPLLAWAP